MESSPPQDARKGTIIDGKFELGDKLGEGGMGVVYRAKHLNADRQAWREVAVKMIRPDRLDKDPEDTQRAIGFFLQEIRLTMRLDSDRTVTVYDAGRTADGEIYCVMKLVRGPTLADIYAKTRLLPLPTALEIARQICEALEAAHGASPPIIHRDLKPSNVFLERWPEVIAVRVGDFGIGKELNEEATSMETRHVNFGTPAYMAPEQVTGGRIGRGTDLYTLGVMLYELLCGRRPFVGRELQAQHVNDAPPPLPDNLPAAARALVERLLAKRREDRPHTAREVRLEIEDIARAPATLLAAFNTTAHVAVPVPRPESSAGPPVPSPPGPTIAGPEPPGVGAAAELAKAVAITPTAPPPTLPMRAPIEPPPRSRRWIPFAAAGAALPLLALIVYLVMAPRPPVAPPELQSKLDRAEQALLGGNQGEAITLALQTLSQQKTERAFSILARSYCRRGEIADARAEFQKLSAGAQPAVLESCRQVGVNLN